MLKFKKQLKLVIFVTDFKERLLSIDIFKGLAIIGVLIFHPSLYNNFHTPENAQSIIPMYLFFLLLPLVLFGTFAGGFPMLSSIVSTFNIYKRTERKVSFRNAAFPIIITGIVLLILDPFKTIFFDRTYLSDFNVDNISYSLFSRLFETGEFVFPGPDKLMQIGLLPSIALSGFMVVFLLWLLLRKEGRDKDKRNIIILSVIGIVWATTYYPLAKFINPYIIQLFYKGGGYTFVAFILRWFVGHQLSFFPMGVYAIFGVILAILVIKKKDHKKIKKVGYGLGGFFGLCFLVSLVVTLFTAEEGPIRAIYTIMDYQIFPKELLFLSLGIMLSLYPVMVKKIEYRTEEEKERIAKRTLPIRRIGVIILTPYIIEPFFNGLISTGFHYAFNGGILYPYNTPDPYMTNPLAILLFEFTVFVFWFLFVYFWSKINFRFGFEHLIISVTNPLRKIKSKKLEPMKTDIKPNKTKIEETDV